MSDKVRPLGISEPARSGGNSSVAMMWLAIGTIASPQRRGQLAGVAVGGDDDVAGGDFAAAGPDPPCIADAGDPADRSLSADFYVAPPAGIEQALVVERRVQFARSLAPPCRHSNNRWRFLRADFRAAPCRRPTGPPR